MLNFLIAHWLALLLIGLALGLILCFAWLALIAAIWRKSDQMNNE